MEYQQIIYETKDNVAFITLNRPEKLNAWTPRMCEEQADAIDKANKDESVGAIIMTGAGRGFCAGADIGYTFFKLDWTEKIPATIPQEVLEVCLQE